MTNHEILYCTSSRTVTINAFMNELDRYDLNYKNPLDSFQKSSIIYKIFLGALSPSFICSSDVDGNLSDFKDINTLLTIKEFYENDFVLAKEPSLSWLHMLNFEELPAIISNRFEDFDLEFIVIGPEIDSSVRSFLMK